MFEQNNIEHTEVKVVRLAIAWNPLWRYTIRMQTFSASTSPPPPSPPPQICLPISKSIHVSVLTWLREAAFELLGPFPLQIVKTTYQARIPF